MRVLAAVMAMALVVALGTGCDRGPTETVEITSPAPGAAVSVPFEVTVEASVPLGSSTADLHHVHIWFSNDLESYLVVEQNVVQVNYAPDGAHEMHVSLRNPDHSAAGVETSVPLMISGGTVPGRN
jgi:hypothetical protein